MKNSLKESDEARRSVDEMALGPASVEKGIDVDGRAGEVPKLAARLKTDAERRTDVDNPLPEPDGCAEVAAGRIGQLDRYAADAPNTARQGLGIQGLDGVAGEADGVFDVKNVSVGCV